MVHWAVRVREERRSERDAHIKRVGYLASRLEQNGVFVVASFVSPYREARQFVRGLCKNFVEVHVATPLAVCEQRDVKGHYRKARGGVIAHFTGITSPSSHPSTRRWSSTPPPARRGGRRASACGAPRATREGNPLWTT